MKFFGKLMITALVLAVLLPFTVLKGKDGRPLMSFSDIKLPNVKIPDLSVPDAIKPSNTQLSPNNSDKDIVYKWKDSSGALHFTSSPPPEGIEFTAKGYDPNQNLIQSVKVNKEEDQETGIAGQGDGKGGGIQNKSEKGIGNPYSPKKIEKLFDDAENVQKILNERTKALENLTTN